MIKSENCIIKTNIMKCLYIARNIRCKLFSCNKKYTNYIE